MKSKTALALVAICLLAGVTFWTFRTSPNKGKAATTEAPKVVTAPATTRTLLPAFDVSTQPDQVGTLRLEGQVVDSTLDGVAGAKVTVDTHPPRVLKTEEDGTFVLEGLLARSYRLVARSPMGAAGPVSVRLTASTEPVILHVRPAPSVEVAVLRANDRRPVAQASIELRGPITEVVTTNDDGIAAIDHLPAGRYQVIGWAPGYAVSNQNLRIARASGVYRQELLLVSGSPVSGRVMTTSGRPVANAQVTYQSASDGFRRARRRLETTTSDSNGAFQFAALPTGTFRFRARHSDYAQGESAPTTLTSERPTTGVEIELDTGATIRGRVLKSDNAGASGAIVRFSSGTRRRMLASEQVIADERGQFEIHGLPRKAMQIVALHESAASEPQPVDLTESPEQSGVILRLTQEGRISGLVVDTKGEPVDGAQVRLTPDFRGGVFASRAGFRLRGRMSELTDAGGRFEFSGLADDVYLAMASHPGATLDGRPNMENATSARTGDTEIKLVLEAQGGAIGKVAFSTGEAPKTFTISTSARTAAIPFAGDKGQFELRNLAPQEYRLTIRGPEFDVRSVEVVVPAGETVDVGTILVLRGRQVSGRVIDESGAPIHNATVFVGNRLSGSGATSSTTASRFGAVAPKEATTDEAGKFSVSGVGPNDLTVAAEHATQGRSSTVAIPRSDASTANLELTLFPPGAVEGVVMIGDQPADTVVTAQSQQVPSATFSVTTGADGRYRFDLLAPDSYLVSAKFGGRGVGLGSVSKAVVLESRETATVDLLVELGEVTLVISAFAGDDNAVEFAFVHVVRGTVVANTAKELEAFLANRPDGFSSMGLIFDGASTRIEKLEPDRYSVCINPMPSGVIGRSAVDYILREGHNLRVFCQETTLDGNSVEQGVSIPVVIPEFVPAAEEE